MANTVKDNEMLDLIEFEEELQEETPKPKKRRKKRPSANTVKKKAESNEGSVPTKSHADLVKDGVQKLQDIRNTLNSSVFERENVVEDILRGLVAKEHILLLGPPGTGKSYLADLLKTLIENATKFSWLMNRTTDPADIVGPYSVSAMENDRFLRITDGKAPKANIIFFDEIFKANEPVLNYMLSMLNEGVIYNDGKAVPVDIRMAIGASNEYPESEDLDAFYDRFVFRHWVHPIQDPQNRIKMAQASSNPAQLGLTKITLEEIDALQKEVNVVTFPTQMFKLYDKMIRALQTQDIYISDRRYIKGQKIMRANALLNGRNQVTSDDFRSLTNMLWNKDTKEIEVIADELSKFINPYESKIKDLVKKAEEVKTKVLGIENRAERAGEAVQANISLQDILEKVEKEIDEAQANGSDHKALVPHYKAIENMMAQISNECLKQNVRGGRDW